MKGVAATITIACALPAAAWNGASGLRLRAAQPASTSSIIMKFGATPPPMTPPPPQEPELELFGIDLSSVKTSLTDAVNDLFFNINNLGVDINFVVPASVVALGAVAVVAREALSTPVEDALGVGFKRDGRLAGYMYLTPFEKDALEYAKNKRSLKGKLVDPIVKKIEDVADAAAEKAEVAKKVAAAKKLEEQKKNEKQQALDDGRLIALPEVDLPGLGAVTGLVVPNPLAATSAAAAAAGDKAKELLPFGGEDEE